eukprot:m.73902 g.73902  ORF g.73902 m.73902 type:complete len:405 (-) comp24602_c1_seq2:192-1406(-)
MGRKRPALHKLNPPRRTKEEDEQREKVSKIYRMLENESVQLSELQECCITKHGLVNKELRQHVWPMLLGINRYEVPDHRAVNRNLEPAKSVNQVKLDIDRSFWRFPKGINDQKRMKLRKRSTEIINAVFAQSRELCYYQGYHEVCAVLMLNCGDTMAFGMACILSSCHLADTHEPTLKKSIAYCELIFAIVGKVDPELMAHITASEAQCHFAISWILTFFSHDVDDFALISRIYDACFGSHPFFCIYLSAALIIQSREKLMEVSCEEMSDMHKALTLIPLSADFESAIAHAHSLITGIYPVSKSIHDSTIAPDARTLLKQSTTLLRFPDFATSLARHRQFKFSPFFMGGHRGGGSGGGGSRGKGSVGPGSAMYTNVAYAVAGSTLSVAIAVGFIFLENIQTNLF